MAPKASAITLRMAPHLKSALKVRAGRSHRSLSAEALSVIEQSLATEFEAAPGSFLGMFGGSRVPTDDDVRKARKDLWQTLGQRKP